MTIVGAASNAVEVVEVCVVGTKAGVWTLDAGVTKAEADVKVIVNAVTAAAVLIRTIVVCEFFYVSSLIIDWGVFHFNFQLSIFLLLLLENNGINHHEWMNLKPNGDSRFFLLKAILLKADRKSSLDFGNVVVLTDRFMTKLITYVICM